MCPTDTLVDALDRVQAPEFRLVDPALNTSAHLVRRKENLLVNGDFRFAQRQVPGTLTTYSTTTNRLYAADRWGLTNGAASTQYQRIDVLGTPETGLNAQCYGKVKKITGAGKVIVSQAVEGMAVMGVRGRLVRLQVKLKGSVAATVRVGLLQLKAAGTIDAIPAGFISAAGAAGTNPTWGTDLALVAPYRAQDDDNCTIAGSALSCAVTTAWQRFSGTFLVPTDCKNLVVVIFTNATMAVNDTLSIAEAGLHEGREIQEYVPRRFEEELRLCRRFFQKTFAVDTGPAQNVGAGTGELLFIAGIAGATAEHGPYRFPATMRAAPTATLYNPAAANAEVRDETAAADCSASSATLIAENSLHVATTGNAGTIVGGLLGVHLALAAEL